MYFSSENIFIFMLILNVLWGIVTLSTVITFRRVMQNNSVKDQEDRLANFAKISYVTGLPSRNNFFNILEERIKAYEILKNSSISEFSYNVHLAVLYIDLDNFSELNEALGLYNGDKLIKMVSLRIVAETQEEADVCVAHLGADEFAVFMEQRHEGPKELIELGKKLLSSISKTFNFLEREFKITASIGICTYPDCCDDHESLLKNAYLACCTAKKEGKNTFCFYTQDLNQKALEKTILSSELSKSLENNQLEIYYQPKISAVTGKVVSAEALIRWNHPDKGLISPEIFIPLAEQNGMINEISSWIISKACNDIYALHKMGFDELKIAINVSPQQFNQGDLALEVSELIWSASLDPSYVELELTESMLIVNPNKTLLMLGVLKSMGMQIAIDDFGTGYSSLSYLINFPVSTLKIDKSFVKNIHLDDNKVSVVKMIIVLAKELKLNLVAEGVEGLEERDMLIDMGVDLLQGYLYSEPIPYDKFTEYVRNYY